MKLTWLWSLMPLVAAPVASLAITQDTSDIISKRSQLLNTKEFEFQIVRESQLLSSLRPTGSSFDFLPSDYLSRRSRNGQFHWGDITLRYRTANSSSWIDASSAAARKAVTSLHTDGLAAANLAPTLPSIPLNITREWIDVDGDLGLRFEITNTAKSPVEIGSLGFPAEFNSIFTRRSAEQIQQKCSLADAYVGMHAGYIRVAPVRGNDSALVVTPLGDTPLEAWRNLDETSYDDTGYGSQTFEGFYEWEVLTKAWAEKEWAGKDPWNPPSSRVLQPGQSLTAGVRFSVANGGVRDIDNTIQKTGTPVAVGIPGYIIPRDLPAQLLVKLPASRSVASISTHPPGSLEVTQLSSTTYQVQPASQAWGRARLTLSFGATTTSTNTNTTTQQTIHYFITKPAAEAVADLGRFLTTAQWFNNASDPFGRAPSPMTYDYETRAIVTQDNRVWIAGLSDEAGAGSFLAATVKQAVQPDAQQVAKLEAFAAGVLWPTIQTPEHGVRKSIFYYQPSPAPGGFDYDRRLQWGGWMSWNKTQAYATDRAYDYVHVVAAYWALYRAGRAYPALLTAASAGRAWDWYLDHAYATAMRCVAVDSSSGAPLVGYSRDGLMGETVFGELLADLKREGQTAKATALESSMRARARAWNAMAVPFGSEMAWDSTGQEGIYYWSKYFGYNATAIKALNTVLGFDPTLPHWGWNGNARRYWDNVYGGKLRRIERQIHHYGSGLNALVLLSAFRSSPADTYMLRVGYGGMNGPLSNINQDGFASASFHSWPDTLKWDGYSGDYGPNFVGLALGAATYLVDDPDVGGLAAYGGVLTRGAGGTDVTVQPRDAVRRKVFVGPLGLLISIDAGIIDKFTYSSGGGGKKSLAVTLSQLPGGPQAASAIIWLETTTGSAKFAVTSPSSLQQARLGWQVPLSSVPVTVTIEAVS